MFTYEVQPVYPYLACNGVSRVYLDGVDLEWV